MCDETSEIPTDVVNDSYITCRACTIIVIKENVSPQDSTLYRLIIGRVRGLALAEIRGLNP